MENLLHLLKQHTLEHTLFYESTISQAFIFWNSSLNWLSLPCCSSYSNCYLMLNNFSSYTFSHLELCSAIICVSFCKTLLYLTAALTQSLSCYMKVKGRLICFFLNYSTLIALPFLIDSVRGFQLHPLTVDKCSGWQSLALQESSGLVGLHPSTWDIVFCGIVLIH